MKKPLLSILSLLFISSSAIAEPSRINWLANELEVKTTEEVKEEETKTVQMYVGKGLTVNESKALKFFQENGIKDRMALAVLLGNIQQESRFTPNICEGGARVKYEGCWTGGYGIIQWTTTGRYDGLGRHARNIGQHEEAIETQLSYVLTEREWKEALWRFKTPDKDMSFYMKGAYRWLGWGIYGNRGYYSQQYYNKLSLETITIPSPETPVKEEE